MARWMLDFDDTLARSDEQRLAWTNKHFKTSYTLADLTSWYPDFPPRILERMWSDNCYTHPRFLDDVLPLSGVSVIHLLKDKGHDFLICSDRPQDLYHNTRAWLDNWGFDLINLRLTRSKHSLASDAEGALTKIQAVQAHKLTHVVEDAPHHALALAQKPYVERVYLLDKPYNQGVHAEKIIRVDDWWHIGLAEGVFDASRDHREDA